MARPRQPARAPRRRRNWARTNNSAVISAGGSTHFDLIATWALAMGGAVPVGATVGRTYISCAFDRTNTPAPSDNVWVGLGVFPSTVEADDIAPGTNLHLDWMYWHKFFFNEDERSGAISGPWEIDVQAMRRMDEIGMRPWLVCEGGATTAGTFLFGSSLLLLLP